MMVHPYVLMQHGYRVGGKVRRFPESGASGWNRIPGDTADGCWWLTDEGAVASISRWNE